MLCEMVDDFIARIEAPIYPDINVYTLPLSRMGLEIKLAISARSGANGV